MMMKLMKLLYIGTGNCAMTTGYLNNLRSTTGMDCLTNSFSYHTYPCRRESAALRYFCA